MPGDIYEAARIDGATAWQQFRKLTLPLLRPFINMAIVLNVIYVFNSFPIIWVMTQGGPSNGTHILVTYLYEKGFRLGKPGEAAAISMVMLAILMVFTIVYLKLQPKSEGGRLMRIEKAKLRRSILCWLVLSPLVVVILFPFAVMFLTAVKPPEEVFVYPARWLPSTFRWQNFADMWVAAKFGVALRNSLYVSISSTLLAISVSIPAAYAMARHPFRGKSFYRQFLLVTQMLSPILLVIGLFRLAAMIHWGEGNLVDQPISVIFAYGAFNIAFAVWMMSSYFATIPKDLEESAWLEGCGPRPRRLEGLPAPGRARHDRYGDLHLHRRVERVRRGLHPDPLRRQQDPHRADHGPGGRTLHRGVAPGDGGHPAGDPARVRAVRVAAALPGEGPGPGRREVAQA